MFSDYVLIFYYPLKIYAMKRGRYDRKLVCVPSGIVHLKEYLRFQVDLYEKGY